eukprot:6300081-Prymnesium_polylepis.2
MAISRVSVGCFARMASPLASTLASTLAGACWCSMGAVATRLCVWREIGSAEVASGSCSWEARPAAWDLANLLCLLSGCDDAHASIVSLCAFGILERRVDPPHGCLLL